MDYNSLSLKMHEEHKGKVEVVSKVAVKNRDDLYTGRCRALQKDP